MSLRITDDPAADDLLSTNPLALLIGMLLDQQVAMETAFAGPLKIEQRVGSMDARTLAHEDPEAFAAAFSATSAAAISSWSSRPLAEATRRRTALQPTTAERITVMG